MKTAVMFSGVDALDTEELRKRVVALPQVQSRLRQAQKCLGTFGASRDDLVQFLGASDKDFHANLPLKAFVCAVVQVGLYDFYLEKNPPPDYMVGCSLGDTARTVCSGTLTFEEMVYGTYLFNSVGQTIQGGAIVRVKSKEPLSALQELEMNHAGIRVAVHQTPRHFLVSGDQAYVKTWATDLAPRWGFEVKPLYDKPLHSVLMSPALFAVKEAFKRAEPKPWTGQLVSSVYTKLIRTLDELRADIEQNMIGPVYWWQTFRWMAEDLGVQRFVNIGPVPTLNLFAERISLSTDICLADLFLPSQILRGRAQKVRAVGEELRPQGQVRGVGMP